MEYKRLPGFYVRNLLLPNALLLSLSGLIFFLPCEGGERVGFGITVTLALCVNLVIVIEFIPETSKTIPEICDYFLVSIFLSGCSLLLAAVILNLYTYSWEQTANSTGFGSTLINFRMFVEKMARTNRVFIEPPATVMNVESSDAAIKDEELKNTENVSEAGFSTKEANTKIKRLDKIMGLAYFLATSLYTTAFLLDMSNGQD